MRIRPLGAVPIVIASIASIAAAQSTSDADAAMAALPAKGVTIEAFVPDGWAIEQRHDADFNRDGRSDSLVLLRPRTATKETPPRILLLAVATVTPPGYASAGANGRLVPRDPTGQLEDPMADGEIIVRPGGFDLKLGMLAGTGSYLAASMRYRFRLETGCVRLIGYDRAETHRATLETRDLSVNFLTGAVIRTTGNAQSDGAKTRRTRLRANPRRCLPDLPSGWTFDPLAAADTSRQEP